MSKSSHIATVGALVKVFIALLILTGSTVLVASYDFGTANTAVALAIACTKASLVIWIFMGVRFNTPLTKVVVASGFLWLLIMFGLGMSDYLTRPWLGVLGR
jgi:cytochrome c oxidase subunit 4